MGKRTHSPEFKREAVRQVLERGVSRSRVARELGVHANLLKRWLEQHTADPQGAFSGAGRRSAESAELERLRRELIRTKAERDILKKAIVCFAKDPP